MSKIQIPPFATMSNVAGQFADTEVTGPLEADEIRQINLTTDEESELEKSLNDAAAKEEEDDELEEQNEVEAAAAANRG